MGDIFSRKFIHNNWKIWILVLKNITCRFKLSDGQSRTESGSFILKADKPVFTVKGSYSFIDEKGKNHEVEYKADDKGYKIENKKELDSPILVGYALSPHILASLVG